MFISRTTYRIIIITLIAVIAGIFLLSAIFLKNNLTKALASATNISSANQNLDMPSWDKIKGKFTK